MMTPEERLKIGLQILRELGPKLGINRSHPEPASTQNFRNAMPNVNTMEDSIRLHTGIDENSLPSLQEILSSSSPITPSNIIIGLCQDGRPLTLELDNPAPGSILIGGDPRSGKTRLLRSVLNSVVLINQPRDVQFTIIAQNLSEYREFDHQYCQALVSPHDPNIASQIEDLVSLVQNRKASRLLTPAILVIIDDLSSLVKELDHQAFSRLNYLIRHGPRSRVWPLASLSTNAVNMVDPRMIAAFRSRLTGSTSNQQLAELLAGQPKPPVDQLTPGVMFTTLLGSEWLYIWVCDTTIVSTDSDQGSAQ